MVDDLARGPGPHVVVDPVFVLEIDKWHRLTTGEPVAFGDHDPIVIVEERDTPHLRQVDLPVLRNLRPDLDEAVPAPVLRRLVELDVETQVRMILGHGFDDPRQQPRIERGERRDLQPGSVDVAETLDQIVEAADRGEDLCRVVGQASAELGDLDAAPRTLVERRPNSLLQGGDVLADGRRCVVEALRGSDDGTGGRDGTPHPQAIEIPHALKSSRRQSEKSLGTT